MVLAEFVPRFVRELFMLTCAQSLVRVDLRPIADSCSLIRVDLRPIAGSC